MMVNLSNLSRLACYPIVNKAVQLCLDGDRASTGLPSYKLSQLNKTPVSNSINHAHSSNQLATYCAGFVELKTLPLVNLRVLYQGYAKKNPQTFFKDFSRFFFKKQHINSYFKALPDSFKTNIATVLACVAASVLSKPFDVAKSAIQNGTQGLYGETKCFLRKAVLKLCLRVLSLDCLV